MSITIGFMADKSYQCRSPYFVFQNFVCTLLRAVKLSKSPLHSNFHDKRNVKTISQINIFYLELILYMSYF